MVRNEVISVLLSFYTDDQHLMNFNVAKYGMHIKCRVYLPSYFCMCCVVSYSLVGC